MHTIRNLGSPPSDIKVITKLPNSEQSYKENVQTHNYINRQNQSTTGKVSLCWHYVLLAPKDFVY
jgi:hypothetical protein